MTELEFNPSSLPTSETLVYKPSAWGLDGELKFQLKKEEKKTEILSFINLGFKLLIKTAISVEAVSSWKLEAGSWRLLHSIHQIRPKNLEKQIAGDSKHFDPISAAYCLRTNPILKIGDQRTALVLRSSGKTHLLIKAVAEKQQEVPVFGPGLRRLFQIKLFPQSEVSKVNFEKDVQVWIDSDTNIVVEAQVKITPIGSVTVRLVKLTN